MIQIVIFLKKSTIFRNYDQNRFYLRNLPIWIIVGFGSFAGSVLKKWSKPANDPDPIMIQIRKWSKSMSIKEKSASALYSVSPPNNSVDLPNFVWLFFDIQSFRWIVHNCRFFKKIEKYMAKLKITVFVRSFLSFISVDLKVKMTKQTKYVSRKK